MAKNLCKKSTFSTSGLLWVMQKTTFSRFFAISVLFSVNFYKISKILQVFIKFYQIFKKFTKFYQFTKCNQILTKFNQKYFQICDLHSFVEISNCYNLRFVFLPNLYTQKVRIDKKCFFQLCLAPIPQGQTF